MFIVRSIFLSAFLLLSTLSVNSQPAKILSNYERGVELYNFKKWNSALEEFKKASENVVQSDYYAKESIAFYIAACSYRVELSNAKELMQDFDSKYSDGLYGNQAAMILAGMLYDEGDYQQAYEKYRDVIPFALESSLLDEYYFKRGYSAFMLERYSDAYADFRMISPRNEYASPAKYYSTYIDYVNQNYNAALDGFRSLEDDSNYAPILPFYILQIQFLQSNYREVVAQGPALLNRSSENRRPEISRVIGESYYHLKDYQNALKYMSAYRQSVPQITREESYVLGYSAYMVYDYRQAISEFSSIVGQDDMLSQNAYYHLGDAYLSVKDKEKAAKAFAMASRVDFNKTIQEDALFNYAKLEFELGKGVFNETINAFTRYINDYPSSPRIPEAREYLIAAYFNSKNYQAALEAVDQIVNPDNEVKSAIQKITYFRALEYITEGNNGMAMRLLDRSLEYKYNPKYTALSSFWKGEVLCKLNQYDNAIPYFKEYLRIAPKSEKEYAMANYNLGYCYFNDKKYDMAREYFSNFISLNKSSHYLSDVYNRMGDVNFAQRKYTDAVTSYDKAISYKGANTDYSKFQRAIMFGLSDKSDRKITTLLDIISSKEGNYVDDAMMELGRTYVKKERFNEGASVLKNLLSQYPNSEYNATATAELGLIYQNMNDDKNALYYYKLVVDKYPNSPQAKDAIIGIRNIYVDNNDIDTYFAYAKNSGIESNISAYEKDSLSFASVERVYLSGDANRSIPLLKNYLSQYDKGFYIPNATFYLGDCLLRTGDKTGALDNFERVAQMSVNSFTSQSVESAAKLAFEFGDYRKAKDYYTRLQSVSMQPQIIKEAMIGELNCAEKLGYNHDAIQIADKVLADESISKDVKEKAYYLRAKSYIEAGDQQKARADFMKLKDNPKSLAGAEAAFQIAQMQFKEGKYKESEKTIMTMSEQGCSHQYWLAKAFVLLGDVYVKQDDKFQAKATYQSVIDGYSNKTDGIVDDAKEKLKKIE